MVRGALYEQVPCSLQLIPCKVTVTKDEHNWCACGEGLSPNRVHLDTVAPSLCAAAKMVV